MALFGNGVDKCVGVLRDLHAARGRLESAIVENEAELAKLRAGVSEDEVLDAFLAGAPAVNSEGFPIVGSRARASGIEDRLSELRGARTALCRRIRAGIVALGADRAGQFRKQAAKRQGELAKHRARTIELLKALEDHTSCKYIVDLHAGADILVDAGGRESAFRRGGSRPAPKSFEYEAEINRLLASAQAAETRAKQNCEGGQISGENLDSLLAVCADIERLAPTEAAVRSWFDRATASAAAEWNATKSDYIGKDSAGRSYAEPAHDTLYSLCWVDGTIVESKSNAKNRQHPYLGSWPTAAASVGA